MSSDYPPALGAWQVQGMLRMAEPSNRERIADLKAQARRHYAAFRHEQDGYDCGIEMLCHMNPRAAEARRLTNAALDELATLDPKAPKARI